MKVIDIIRRSGRSLKSAKMRTLLTATAIAIGGFTLIITLAASNGARSYVDRILQENFDPAELIVYRDKSIFGEDDKSKPPEYNESAVFGASPGNVAQTGPVRLMTEADIQKLQKQPSVESVTPMITVAPRYITRVGQKKFVGSLSQVGSRQRLTMTAGNQNLVPGKRQIILPQPFVGVLGFKSDSDAVGQKIIVAIPVASGMGESGEASSLEAVHSAVEEVEFTVIGVRTNSVAQEPGSEFALQSSVKDLKSLHDLMNEGQVSFRSYPTVMVRVKGGEDKSVVSEAQSNLAKLGYETKSSEDLQQLINNFISTLQIIITVFSVITVIASVFGIINTLYISVLERTREIGLMKALGMRKSSVNLLFIFEAMWIGFLGGVMGVLAGYGLGTLINPSINKQLKLGEGINLLEFHFQQMALLVLALMLVAMIAGLLPARKAAKLDPIEALRTE